MPSILSKSSLLFLLVNLLRVLSIVGICMALSGEIVVMVSNIEGLTANGTSFSTTSTSASTPLTTAALSGALTVGGAGLARREMQPISTTSSRTIASAVSTAVESSKTSSLVKKESSATASCSYIGNTDVPDQVGGALFSTLERIFCCILLLFALISEMPPPSKYTQLFWAYAFPPLGETFGVGVLGIMQVFIGCSILSHAVSGFPLVAAWFLFILGFLNMLFGLALGAKVKSLRSVFSTPDAPSGLRSLTLNAAPHAGAASSSYYTYDTESRGGNSNGKRGIQISAPMVQVAPPIYGRN